MFTKRLFKYYFQAFTSLTFFVLSLFAPNFGFSQASKQNSKNAFVEVIKEFPRQEKNLRKWDAPVVADLDQDGYPDLLINDHGYGIQVCWNNKGKFAKPYDIIMGDLHGVSVGDFDKDGVLEIMMSRGGGSGSNARNSKLFRVTKQREFIDLPDFNVPLETMRGRTVKFLDADNDGDLDLLNFAFPDSDKNGESENYVYSNNGNGQLMLHSTLPAIKVDGQKTLITDFNGDNKFDIILYGNGTLKAYQGKGDLTYTDVSKKVFPYEIEDVTGIVEIDYDNDGDFDLFITRGNEFEKGDAFYDAETKTLGFYTKRGEFQLEDLEVGDVLNLENFQSQWPNNDTYFIGEASYDYEFEGETHSGKNIRLVNSDALGFPDKTNYEEKKGWYIGFVGNNKWRIAGFLWAPATGIVHGVENYTKTKQTVGLQNVLLENTGKAFKDVTKDKVLLNKEHSMGVSVADFDNNGLQDLLVIKRGDLIHKNESLIYLNKGVSGFELLKDHNIISSELGAIGMAVETFDYNQDGKVDVVIGNERGKWHLFKNELDNASKNNFITIEVGNSMSGKATALGALVEIQSCGKKQMKRVGSTGAAYSLSFNDLVHFGLGSCDKNIKVKVTWTNGEILEKNIKTVNTKIVIGNKN
jgi:hypothetical protein